jgi:hypothetical protein
MTLHKAIEDLLASDLPDSRGKYITDGYYDDLPEVVQNVVDAACEELIAAGGRPDHAAMCELSKAFPSVRVGPGERDSFGWLSGVVHTSKGMITYG